jgi:hypothetical protein
MQATPLLPVCIQLLPYNGTLLGAVQCGARAVDGGTVPLCAVHMFSTPSTRDPLLFVDDVHRLFNLTEEIGWGSYARVRALEDAPGYTLRTVQLLGDEYDEDMVSAIPLLQTLSDAQISPRVLAYYKDGKGGEAMLMRRYTMNLYEYVRTTGVRGNLLVLRVCALFRKMAQRGIVCSDVKPDNIVVLLDDHNHIRRIRLIDFLGGYSRDLSNVLASTANSYTWHYVYLFILLSFVETSFYQSVFTAKIVQYGDHISVQQFDQFTHTVSDVRIAGHAHSRVQSTRAHPLSARYRRVLTPINPPDSIFS